MCLLHLLRLTPNFVNIILSVERVQLKNVCTLESGIVLSFYYIEAVQAKSVFRIFREMQKQKTKDTSGLPADIPPGDIIKRGILFKRVCMKKFYFFFGFSLI